MYVLATSLAPLNLNYLDLKHGFEIICGISQLERVTDTCHNGNCIKGNKYTPTTSFHSMNGSSLSRRTNSTDGCNATSKKFGQIHPILDTMMQEFYNSCVSVVTINEIHEAVDKRKLYIIDEIRFRFRLCVNHSYFLNFVQEASFSSLTYRRNASVPQLVAGIQGVSGKSGALWSMVVASGIVLINA